MLLNGSYDLLSTCCVQLSLIVFLTTTLEVSLSRPHYTDMDNGDSEKVPESPTIIQLMSGLALSPRRALP